MPSSSTSYCNLVIRETLETSKRWSVVPCHFTPLHLSRMHKVVFVWLYPVRLCLDPFSLLTLHIQATDYSASIAYHQGQ